MDDMGDFVTDFDLSFEPMAELGWRVSTVPWRSGADWDEFDAVYICTPWDYPDHLPQFLEVLETIEASRALLVNSMSLVTWNLEKTYLRDVARRGGDIVPSRWYDNFDATDPDDFFTGHRTDQVVIKPTVGANAKDTFVLTRPIATDMLQTLRRTFEQRPFFVQPFIETIRTIGEYSLFFFNGEYSHAIQKTPKPGDFRVQEEHGARIDPVQPPDALRRKAEQLFGTIEPLSTYGRGDWVCDHDGRYLLMELELIEPSLYLRTNRAAAARFAGAFNQRFEEFAGIRTLR